MGKNELMEINILRENSQKNMREVLRLSKRAILSIHQKRFTESKSLIAKAKEIREKLHLISLNNPEIIFTGMYSSALQEFCEANILLELLLKEKYINPRELNVPYSEYILGLADVIGEFRRLTLDSIREGAVENAKKYLAKMDQIYIELLGLDEAYMLVHGLRRKCDVARKIIETTRGDVTQEVRRQALEKSLKKIENSLKKYNNKS
jgi:translin